MNTINSRMPYATTPAQQDAIIEAQKQAIIKAKKKTARGTYNPNEEKYMAEVVAFNSAYNAARTPADKYALINAQRQAMPAPVYQQAPVRTVEQDRFATEMSQLNNAYATAAPAQQRVIAEQQKQAIVKAKKQGVTATKSRDVAAVEKEVQAFLNAYYTQPTPEQQQVVIANETAQMLVPETPASEFETKMAQYDAAMAAAQTPEQQQVIVDGAKQTVLKEKRVRKGLPKNYDAANSRLYAEVLKFNAALAAAQTPEAKQAIIETEKKAMLQPQRTVDKKYTEFECEMSDLNSALANAKTRTEQNQLLEEQKETIIKAKKRGMTKAEESEDDIAKAIAAFNAAMLAAKTEEQQQKLIDIEKRALLKAEKEIQVKNADQEVFEAEMSGYDEAYAAAESDLEKLTILEAQKQAIIKAKKKGVTKAQKAAKEGKELNNQQVRLDILEAELVALKSALARAESEIEKRALIDAEKDALIEAKKQVAMNEGAIAPETEVAEAVAPQPAKKANKRADKKAKKLAKKQAVEDEVPVPHNKRGKISEKTLESGTVK
jgi:hypothetical protein